MSIALVCQRVSSLTFKDTDKENLSENLPRTAAPAEKETNFQRIKELISKARRAEKEQDIPTALRLFQRASQLAAEPNAKLAKKIVKIEVC